MSFAFLPLYTGDYRRDTQHLSCSEHGIYLLLLMHCWDTQGPAPLDERKLAGICNARSGDEIEALRRMLREFFVPMDDGWYNERMQREIERAANISNARSDAGRRGYTARAKQLPSKSQAIASTPTTTTTTTTTTKEPKSMSGKPDVTRPELWNFKEPPKTGLEAHYLLAFLNKVADKRFKAVAANLAMLTARLKEASVDEIKHVIVSKANEWGADPKMSEYLRPATLFNATKFAQYHGELR